MRIFFIILSVAVCLSGCVSETDVRADARLRRQAMAAYDARDYRRARAIIDCADRLYVPRAELWRRTLDLRLARAAGRQQGELRRLLLVWGEQRSDWSVTELAEAELALAEAFGGDYAQDWLYDLEPEAWPAPLKTRYNLLLTRLQAGRPALYDDTVARWRMAIRGLYDAGNLSGAAMEAGRCAREQRNAEAALTAAKLYGELGDRAAKERYLNLTGELTEDEDLLRELGQVRAAPLGVPIAF